jgi:hypothetical protein
MCGADPTEFAHTVKTQAKALVAAHLLSQLVTAGCDAGQSSKQLTRRLLKWTDKFFMTLHNGRALVC